MKKFKPIQIREYTPLTELEMKNVFGGSGESGESGEKCKNPDTICTITYSLKDPSKYLRENIPYPEVPGTQFGKCQTDKSGTWTGSSGSTVTIAACECILNTVPSYQSGEINAVSSCEQKP